VPILRHQADRIAASARAWRKEIEAAVGDRTKRLTLLTIAMIAGLADALCFILCFRAVQVHTSVDVLLVAYAIGMVGALLPLLPGGIGVMEAAIPAFLLHAHVPVVRALAGVLAYRMLATVAPAIVGAGILANFHIGDYAAESCGDHVHADADRASPGKWAAQARAARTRRLGNANSG